ncbi:MAG: RnfABCDGE type electron transport complex subunit G [Bacteroidales bacterium]|nr:RnfABCDGE type electron transport complex subunit G [Bacteroidales bacterium]
MAKKESSLKNMLIALFVITAISGGLLGLVYGMTKDTIAEVDAKKNAQAIAEVLGTDENSKLDTVTIDGLFYNLAYDAQDQFLGAAVKTYSNAGFNGRIELMVGILADGTIKAVSVLSQSETPGLGANMVNPKFKDQFSGKNPATYNLTVSKDGGDVDAITAATISSRAFTGAVKLACDGFEANKSQFMKGGNAQ